MKKKRNNATFDFFKSQLAQSAMPLEGEITHN
jgi:hypothetical protein